MRPARPLCFRLLCATLLVASLALAAAPPKQHAAFDSGDRALDIPILVEDNGHVVAQFKVNGVGPVWFALDTGASHAGINSDFATQLKIELTGKKGVARGAGGSQASENGEHIEFALPGVTMRDQTAAIYSMEFMSRRAGRPVAGIIGREFFEAFVVEIDFANQRMHLYDPKTWSYNGKGSVVPLTFNNAGHPYVEATAVMPNNERVQGRFVLDLGSAFPLMVAEKYTAEHNLLKTLPASLSIQARGVGGPVETRVGRVASIQLGDFTLKAPFAAFPQGGGYITDANSPGNIGAPVLSRFRVIFDYTRKRMILEPGERFAEPFEFDMSGLSVQAEGDAFDQLSVLRITPGSPAEAAGFAVGDKLVSVNGEPATSIAALRRLWKQPDRQFDVVIRRGETTQTVKFTTRRMI